MISKKAVGMCVVAINVSLLSSSPAVASEFDWKPCKAEIEKFCKGVTGDEKLWACLEKNDEKLSKTCDAAHGKYEEQTGRTKR